MTILGMKKRFEGLNTDSVINTSMVESQGDIRDLNLEQMYDGKTREGVDITPSYLNDPYWDTHGGRNAAQAYSDWKDRITPNPRRTKGIPNLFINGYYHSTISVTVAGERIVWSSTFRDEPDIRDRFKNIYGLGGRYKTIFLFEYLTPVLREKIFVVTGLMMKK